MGYTKEHFGRPSYTLVNDDIQVFVSAQGGHMTAFFATGGRTISPYYVAPWWKEQFLESEDWIIRVLRGDYFCFPFGGNAEPFQGRKYPIHGNTANSCWDFLSIKSDSKERSLSLRMDLDPDSGEVEKSIRLLKGHPVLYINHIVRGFTGKSPVGNHPNLQCPGSPGSAFLDMSPPLAGLTSPTHVDVPENKGYGLLREGIQVEDRSRIPTVHGGNADLTRYPLARGYEDIILFVSDPSREFTYTSVAFPEQGYLYFQLKNPRILSESLFWMPNGGRYYPPFSGRLMGLIGLEEITGYFHYGINPSVRSNPLMEKGYPTFIDFSKRHTTEIKLIAGVVPIQSDFIGVQDISRIGSSAILIQGRGGQKIEVACETDFLRDE